MIVYDIKQLLKTKRIQDIPLRVTYYARVSTDKDDQLNSLENQVSYYTDLIKNNKNWTFVPGYIDEGISGLSTKKRERFNCMIEDGARGKFDMVITKEVSRFARNTLDSIMYTRQLLDDGVAVYFETEGFTTLDNDSEFRLSIMATMSQQELNRISERVKFGHRQAIKNGVVLGNSRIFGYTKQNGRLVIDEEEGTMVRELFTLYATNDYSMKQIETIFWNKGYRNHNGNKIAHTTMSNMISNMKYKGYYVGNKVRITNMFTKKQRFLSPDEWVVFKDETGEIIPAIVSEELWDQANAILKRRSDDVKYRQGICNHANLLTGKLFCTCCGTPYYRRESKDRQGNANSRWVCSGKIKNGADSCESFPIYESDIQPILFSVFNDTNVNVDKLIDTYIQIYKEQTADKTVEKRIKAQKTRVEKATEKKSKLLQLVTDGNISDSDFKQLMSECNLEIEKAQQEISELENQLESSREFSKHIETIRRTLQNAKKCAATQMITKDFVESYIDKIYVTPEGDNRVRLDIKIFTGETTEKYLDRLVSRSQKKKANGAEEIVDGSTGHIMLTI